MKLPEEIHVEYGRVLFEDGRMSELVENIVRDCAATVEGQDRGAFRYEIAAAILARYGLEP